MSKLESLQKEPQQVTPAEVKDFMRGADNLLDKTFKIDQGDGPLTVELSDALNMVIPNETGDGTTTTPVVRLHDPETGVFLNASTEDFLRWVKIASPVDQAASLEANKASGYEILSHDEQQLVEATDGEAGSDNIEVEDSALAARRDIVRLAAAEKLGLPDDVDIEVISNEVQNRLTTLVDLLGSIQNFEGTRKLVAKEITHSLEASRNLLAKSTRSQLAEFIDRDLSGLEALVNEARAGKSPVSGGLRELLANNQGVLRLRSDSGDMMHSGQNFIEMEPAQKVLRTMQGMEALPYSIGTEIRELETLLTEVSDYRSATEFYESISAPEKSAYRNKQVEVWASDLASENITPERIAEIESEMAAAVALEAGMIDDPNSPQVWFDQDVVRNRSKSRREGTHASGRQDADTTSWLYVSELMSDMLTGKYDVKRGNSPLPIELVDRHGPAHQKVRSGVHRTAALAMLYGDSWIDVATAKGILVEQVKR